MPVLTAKDLGTTPQEFEQALAKQREGRLEEVQARIAALTPEQKAKDLERRRAAWAALQGDMPSDGTLH